MPRPLQRVRLESGLSVNLAKLARQGIIAPGAKTGPRVIRWNWVASGECIASGLVTADLQGPSRGWIKLELNGQEQWFELRAHPRHFGGRQWYFCCQRTGRDVSVMWRPNGATRFASRQAWGLRVAYGSQFETPHERALNAAHAIRQKLNPRGGFSCLDEPIPPKPKWMRWRTYERITSKCERYEATCEAHLIGFLRRLERLG